MALVTARLLFAVLVYAQPQLALANDTDRYVPIAKSIVAGEAYAWNTERQGELLNTVGYPLFLAGVYVVRGTQPGDVALAQLAASGLLVLALYLGLSHWVGRQPAFVSALLLCVDPLMILWSMTVLTETLFAVLFALGALALAWWVHSDRRPALALSGLFCGLACLVKPFAMLVAVVWAAALIWTPRAFRVEVVPPLRTRLGRAVLFLAPVALLIAPWFVRNSLLWNCPSLSSVDRVTMRDYMAAKVVAESERIDLSAAQAQLQAMDPGVCPHETGRYLGIILSHPGVYGKLHLAGTIPVLIGTNFDRWLQYFGTDYTLPDLWRPYMDGGWKGLLAVVQGQLRAFPQAVALMAGLTIFQLLLFLFALSGVAAFRKGSPREFKLIIILMTAAVLVLVLAPGQGGHERFRVPVEPLLVILGAYGIAARRTRWLGGPDAERKIRD